MTHQPIKSSNIESVAYDSEARLLHVKTKAGTTYEYSGISPELHQGLLNANSVGSYIHQNLKEKFPCKIV